LGRVPLPWGREKKSNRVALFVHGALEVGPLPLDFHIRLSKPPAAPHGTLAATERLFKLRGVPDHPAVQRGRIHRAPSLAPHLFELPIRTWVGHIPAHRPQADLPLNVPSLEVTHAAAPPPCHQWQSIRDLSSTAQTLLPIPPQRVGITPTPESSSGVVRL